MEITDLRPGQRIQMGPWTDIWMCGDRYGTVTSVGYKAAVVRLDVSGRLKQVYPSEILEVISDY